METIYSDGKSLEIEQKLKCTVYLPQLCHFCLEEIQKFGKESDSLCFHSLDGDHENWVPTNKVPAHIRCHLRYHVAGRDKNPMEGRHHREETCKRMSETHTLKGDDHHMKRPKQRQRMRDHNPMKRPEVVAKRKKTMLERYGHP